MEAPYKKKAIMMTIEQIRDALKDRNARIVSRSTGLSYPTVLAIKNGRSIDPRYSTIKTLSEYLEG